MVRFIKAYNEPDGTIFEVAVTATNAQGAKVRGSMWLFGRMPMELTAMEGISVFQFTNSGVLNEYRVSIKLASDSDIISLIQVDKVMDEISDKI